MSLYGALRSGVSAMQSQTQAMAMVSNNIANLNTNGFKRTAASFSTLVSGASSATTFAGGSVISRPNLKVDSVGQITKTLSNTDMSVNGQGFFPVSQSSETVFNITTGRWENTGEVLYTRLGDFSKNKDGLLENSAGYILLAWPRNTADNGYEQTNLPAQLAPVTISDTTGTPKATTTININANLSSNQSEARTFPATVDVFDRQGTSHVMQVNFTRSTTESRTYEVSAEMLNTDATIITKRPNTGAYATNPTLMSSLYKVTKGTPVVKLQYDSPLVPPTDLAALASGYSISYTDNTGTVQTQAISSLTVEGAKVTLALSDVLPPAASDGTPSYTDARIIYDPAATTAPLQGYTMNADGTLVEPRIAVNVPALNATPNAANAEQDAIIQTAFNLGKIRFSEDGTITTDGSILASSLGLNNAGTVGASGITISFDFAGDGETKNANGKTDDVSATINFAAQSGNTGMTSYDSPHTIYSINQNGSTAGSFKAVQVNSTGEVEASFSVGDSRRLAQIPVVMFSSVNDLEQVDGNAFRRTNAAGTQIIRTAGSAGAGLITSSTLESSNVDLATEFTDMIVTQRAYSASTKIITTADEMLEELVRAKR